MLLGKGSEHDLEKCLVVFQKERAQSKTQRATSINRRALAAHGAELGLGLFEKIAVTGLPQHAFYPAVAIAHCERGRRVAKYIAHIRVGSMGKQLLHDVDVAAIRGPHQGRGAGDVRCVAIGVMGK
jgi:uncharacterized protein YcsI (UPF0317 family)